MMRDWSERLAVSRSTKRIAYVAILAVTVYTSCFGVGTDRLAAANSILVLALELVGLLVVWMLPTAYDASHLKGGSRFGSRKSPDSAE